MKLTIEQKPLAATLKRIGAIVESRNTIPILGNVVLTASDGQLNIMASDVDIEASATIAANVERSGAITAPAKMLADIVGKLAAGSLVEMSLDDGSLTVKAGRSRFKLATLPVDDFPQLASDKFEVSFTMSAGEIRSLMSGQFAASTDETRYYLQGVYLHPRDGQTLAVATDGHRLAKVTLNAGHDFPGVIVPKKTITQLLNSMPDDEIQIDVSATKIRFSADTFTLLSKVIDGTFPDYTRVIPQSQPHNVTFYADEMVASVDRVVTVADDKSKVVKIAITQDGIAVSNRSSNSSASDEVSATLDGDACEIGFNGAFLSQIVGQMDGRVSMHFNGPLDPVLFTQDGQGDARDGVSAVYVLMPMRVV